MQTTDDLSGQLARLPDGQKVMVESQEGVPPRALVRRIEGPRAETWAVCRVSKLEPLGPEKSQPPGMK